MKVLVVASCLLAVAYAGVLAPIAYHGAHIPVLDHNGYQIDTADVATAKAAHFAAHGEALARLGHIAAAPFTTYAAAPVASYAAAYPIGYAGPHHIPVIGPNGVPLETPEVVAAKVNHAAAHVEAKARNGDLAFVAPVAGPIAAYAAAPLAAYAHAAAPVAINGVPLDTVEVAAAKSAHFAAHIEAKTRNGVIHPLLHLRKRRGVFAPAALAAPIAPLAYAAPQHLPVIGPNGVPLETPEVVAAKVSHAAAHIDAKARNGDFAVVAPIAAPISTYAAAPISTYAAAPITTYAAAPVTTYAAAPIASYAAAYPLAYAGPQHIPVIGPNGVPLETPEVVAAKVNHAAAHVDAKARNGDFAVVAPVAAPIAAYAAASLAYAGPQHLPVIGPNGVPIETPEVVAAKVEHAAAHVEAKARNGDLAVVAPVAAYAAAPVAAYAAAPITTYAAAPITSYAAGYYGPQHIPVIGPNGVPIDTPEVAAGKAANTAAHIEAKVRNGDLALHY